MHYGRTLNWRFRGSMYTEIKTETDSWNTVDDRKKGWCSKAGKTRTTRSFMQTGLLAEAPIALCEVQAYVYGAKMAAASLAAALWRQESS